MTFEGEVQQLDLMNKLVELWREKFTGALRFESDAVIKIIYFKQGNIISASTNDRADSIDEVLTKAGKINKEHVRQALAKRKESETLGDALLGLGFITKKELAWARRVQLVGVIRSILGWSAGNFTIVADYLPKREEGTIFYVPQIVLELIVTDPDRDKFVKALDDGNVVFLKSDDFDADYPFLGLNEDADRIVEMIDGSRSATDIAGSSAMDSFNVFKLLHALRALGLIQTEKPQESLDVFPDAEHAFDFQLDDAPAADEDWALPPSEPEPAAAFATEPEIPAATVAEFPQEESLSIDGEPAAWPASPEPAAADDEFNFETSSSAKAEEWITQEEEPSVEIPEPPAAATVVPAPREEFSLSVDPDIIGGEPERPAFGRESAALESGPASEALSATRPRASQRPAISAPPKRRTSKAPMLIATVAIIVVAALGAGWFFFMRAPAKPDSAVASATTPSPTPVPVPVPAPATTTETAAPASTTPLTESAGSAPATTGSAPQPVASGTTAPAPAIQPAPATAKAPAPATAPNPTRAKYEQMAAEYARDANPAEFTVQFELVCQADSITRAMRDGGGNVWFTPTSFKGNTCFRVFWGHYPTRAAADAAIAQIPASLRAGSKSTAVKVSEVVK